MEHLITTDILIAGGVAAALAATAQGCRVILTEETDWIGGQLTQQAVPPDEHSWIEDVGCTLGYRRYEARTGIRDWHAEIIHEHHAEPFADSVGIGFYRIDLHPSNHGQRRPPDTPPPGQRMTKATPRRAQHGSWRSGNPSRPQDRTP